ncbi:uncharacterized protein METZ01_LOCUS331540 [marine metagenome]|uniref:Uncharacterized protein n=1 Tax=marine metagenome TaxID=408172 RepID=A0A382PZS4_9ZZZZ
MALTYAGLAHTVKLCGIGAHIDQKVGTPEQG